MSTPVYLGIKTQNAVIGLTSTNPGTANALSAAQQPTVQQDNNPQVGRWNQGQGVPVIEVPWHKATPAMKNIK